MTTSSGWDAFSRGFAYGMALAWVYLGPIAGVAAVIAFALSGSGVWLSFMVLCALGYGFGRATLSRLPPFPPDGDE